MWGFGNQEKRKWERAEALAAELRVTLDRLIVLFDAENAHWKDWMVRARNKLNESHAEGARYLKGAYGGLGSINDFIVSSQSDAELHELLERAYGQADDLERF